MKNCWPKAPSESMGGTRGELVPTRVAHREQSEPCSFRKSCVRHKEVFAV